jgi:TPR repeat protein
MLTLCFRNRAVTLILFSTLVLGACADPLSMVASSILSAAIRTGIESAQKNRADPEKLWQQAQLAQTEQNAIAGDVDAQFQLGLFYLLRQEPSAADWICHAANQGHGKAQLQYGHLFNEDRKRDDLFPFISISPDNIQAFIWYSLSANNGEPRGVLFRNNVKRTGLNSQRLHSALTGVENWKSTPCGHPAPLAQPQRTSADPTS